MGNTDVVVTPNADTGAQSQGRKRRAEVTNCRAESAAQTSDRLCSTVSVRSRAVHLVGSADTVPHAMLCHYPLMLIGDIGNLPLGLASAHDARASVNIPQFRGATHEQFHQGMPLVAALIMSATARSSSSNSKPPRRPRILSRRTNHPISQLRRM